MKEVDKGIDSIKEYQAEKEDKIKQKDEEILKQKYENKGLFEENEKIKRCARNIDKEIKLLRAWIN